MKTTFGGRLPLPASAPAAAIAERNALRSMALSIALYQIASPAKIDCTPEPVTESHVQDDVEEPPLHRGGGARRMGTARRHAVHTTRPRGLRQTRGGPARRPIGLRPAPLR